MSLLHAETVCDSSLEGLTQYWPTDTSHQQHNTLCVTEIYRRRVGSQLTTCADVSEKQADLLNKQISDDIFYIWGNMGFCVFWAQIT